MRSRIPQHELFERLSKIAREALEAARLEPLVIQSKCLVSLDPVTSADRACEQALRAVIEREFPSDAIHGEELRPLREGARRSWSIDPIDGTRAFICGLPTWAILVGVVEDGRHLASMIDLPAIDETFIAVGGKTMRNGEFVQTSGEVELHRSRLSTTDPFLFEGEEARAFDRLRRSVALTRYGLDGTAYARLAAGDLDLVMETGLKRHDYDALVPVVRGAGGHIGDWDGGEDFASGRILAAASRELYGRAAALIAK